MLLESTAGALGHVLQIGGEGKKRTLWKLLAYEGF